MAFGVSASTIAALSGLPRPANADYSSPGLPSFPIGFSLPSSGSQIVVPVNTGPVAEIVDTDGLPFAYWDTRTTTPLVSAYVLEGRNPTLPSGLDIPDGMLYSLIQIADIEITLTGGSYTPRVHGISRYVYKPWISALIGTTIGVASSDFVEDAPGILNNANIQRSFAYFARRGESYFGGPVTVNGGPDPLSSGAKVVYRCTVAGTLPVGTLTTDPSKCGASVDSGLRVS